MSKKHYLNGVFQGKVRQGLGFSSAIEKSSIKSDVLLTLEGLEGDECADKRHHGGLERALHQYPSEHYAFWSKSYYSATAWQAPGMGENMSSLGMTEKTVCIGDRYRWGDAIIEVSQPRSPCFKLNKRWGIENFSVFMQKIGRCGWLYRVIQPGIVNVSQPLQLIDRVENALTVHKVSHVFFNTPLDHEGLIKLKEQKRLTDSWRIKINQRMKTGKVESWNNRLLGG